MFDNQAKKVTTSFKSSCVWIGKFIKRKKIKFRRRKFGKEQTAEDCIGGFEEFLNKLKFDFLHPNEDNSSDGIIPLWDVFHLEQRYNMDQVFLSFVNGQYYTLTVEYDSNVKIKCPK